MYKMMSIGILALLVFCISPVKAEENQAQAIFEKVDNVRKFFDCFSVDAKIISYKGDNKVSDSVLKIYSKGSDNVLVNFILPTSDKGKKLLMKGNNLWMYFPSNNKSIRIPPAQRLNGEVSNGDVARSVMSEDFYPVKLSEEKEFYVLELKAKTASAPYGQITLWINKSEDSHMTRAEFYTFSGKLLKVADYEGYKFFGEKEFPTRMVITDAINKSNKSVIEYENVAKIELSDEIFTLQNLAR